MNLEQINLVLQNISKIVEYHPSHYPKVLPTELQSITQLSSLKSEDENEIEVYKLPYDNYALLVKVKEDSYGGNDRIVSLKIGKPITKTIETYE